MFQKKLKESDLFGGSSKSIDMSGSSVLKNQFFPEDKISLNAFSKKPKKTKKALKNTHEPNLKEIDLLEEDYNLKKNKDLLLNRMKEILLETRESRKQLDAFLKGSKILETNIRKSLAEKNQPQTPTKKDLFAKKQKHLLRKIERLSLVNKKTEDNFSKLSNEMNNLKLNNLDSEIVSTSKLINDSFKQLDLLHSKYSGEKNKKNHLEDGVNTGEEIIKSPHYYKLKSLSDIMQMANSKSLTKRSLPMSICSKLDRSLASDVFSQVGKKFYDRKDFNPDEIQKYLSKSKQISNQKKNLSKKMLK